MTSHALPLPIAGSPISLSTRLVTQRLVLRPPRASDVPALRRALRRNTEHLRPWSAATIPGEDPSSLTAVSKAVLRQRREWKRGESFVFLMTSRTLETSIVGRIALGSVQRGVFQNTYLGYWIDEEHRGLGLMPEGVTAVLDFAFEVAGLHRVQAAVIPRNTASIRVMEKVGFRREGLAERYLCIAGKWEDHAIFALTREEWPGAKTVHASPF
jgi:ribosomal-protein-alanine N-acetyltransferase